MSLKEVGGVIAVLSKEVGGAGVVLQQLAVRPIVSYGFVGIAFVSVSRLCPYNPPPLKFIFVYPARARD